MVTTCNGLLFCYVCALTLAFSLPSPAASDRLSGSPHVEGQIYTRTGAPVVARLTSPARRLAQLAVSPVAQAQLRTLGGAPVLAASATRHLAQAAGNTSGLYGCVKTINSRDLGQPLDSCPAGLEQSGALCYPPCEAGYTGAGPVCWQNCPGNFRDDGAFCGKPDPQTRQAYPWEFGDTPFDDAGMFKRCQASHGQGTCELCGLIVYPKCPARFHTVGCPTCSPNCDGLGPDIGVSCTKKTYTRAGVPLICDAQRVQDGGLCYTPCQAGFEGAGALCLQSACPASLPNSCGLFCASSAPSKTCTDTNARIGKDAAAIIAAAVTCVGAIVTGGAAIIGCVAAALGGGGAAGADLTTFLTDNFDPCATIPK